LPSSSYRQNSNYDFELQYPKILHKLRVGIITAFLNVFNSETINFLTAIFVMKPEFIYHLFAGKGTSWQSTYCVTNFRRAVSLSRNKPLSANYCIFSSEVEITDQQTA